MSDTHAREWNFDGLVGPTHGYGGLSPGNLASTAHQGEPGNPKAAALQGIEKMRQVSRLGVGQAVLPPHPRPDLGHLRAAGIEGREADLLRRAARDAPRVFAEACSASAMWTANAATVAPASDTRDGRLHLCVANLSAMPHRALEAPVTFEIFRTIFAERDHFEVSAPLPPELPDEGAANHLRLATGKARVHVFGWGRPGAPLPAGEEIAALPQVHPARQTREASREVARRLDLEPGEIVAWQQAGSGIDAGAFHSDVLAVSNANVLLVHEQAFANGADLLRLLAERLGSDFVSVLAREGELPVADAVAAYPFNSQLLSLPDGRMTIVAPEESRENAASRDYLARVVEEDNPVAGVHYIDVNQSMKNGGGPACLRLRVVLEPAARAAIRANVFFDDALDTALTRWFERHYRDRLVSQDLTDPAFLDEMRTGLDELTQLLEIGSVYEFQKI